HRLGDPQPLHLRERHHLVDCRMAVVERLKDRVELRVAGAVEVIPGQELKNTRRGRAIDEEGAQDTLLGIQALGQRFLGKLGIHIAIAEAFPAERHSSRPSSNPFTTSTVPWVPSHGCRAGASSQASTAGFSGFSCLLVSSPFTTQTLASHSTSE